MRHPLLPQAEAITNLVVSYLTVAIGLYLSLFGTRAVLALMSLMAGFLFILYTNILNFRKGMGNSFGPRQMTVGQRIWYRAGYLLMLSGIVVLISAAFTKRVILK